MDLMAIQEYFISNPGVLWVVAAVVFIIIEVSIPGIGGLFSGVAALSLGTLLIFDIIAPETFIAQLAWFFGLTIFWAVVLWKPLKKMMKPSGEAYSDIIGSPAKVVSRMEKGKLGTVKWSGTTVRSRIIETSAVDSIDADQEVWIHDKDGTVLLIDVSPVNSKNNS